MPRRFLLLTALLLTGTPPGAPAAVGGELGYSDVDPFDIEMTIYEDAEAAVEKAEAALAGLRPTDDHLVMRRIGEVLSYLCEAHAELGQYAQAEAACLEAVATFDEVDRHDVGVGKHYKHRLALPRLSGLYEMQHRHDRALAVLEEQLELASTLRGDNQAAQLLHRIANLQLAVGHFREAETAYQEAISRSAEAWSGDPWSGTTVYMNLALLYRLEERFDMAEATLKEGIAEAERSQAERAKRNASPALRKLEALAAPLLLQGLGWVYYEQGQYGAAREAALHSLAHFEGEGEAEDWIASTVKILLARIADAEHPGSSEAGQYLASAALVPEDDIPTTHLLAAIGQSEQARHHLLSRDYVEAEPLAREAAENLAWLAGEVHFETARAKARLAQALHGQGKAKEALPFALAAYVVQRQVLPPYHRETGETLTLLIELYEVLGRREDLAATRKLLKDHQAAREAFERQKS